jgi:hypothetical protein
MGFAQQGKQGNEAHPVNGEQNRGLVDAPERQVVPAASVTVVRWPVKNLVKKESVVAV